jgi:hypothetical protein
MVEKVDALEALRKHEERERLREQFENKVWTLEEIQRLERATEGDIEKLREWEALRPSMEASRQRGEWTHPNDMTHKQYREYTGAGPDQLVLHESDLPLIQEGAEMNVYGKTHEPAAVFWRKVQGNAVIQPYALDAAGKPIPQQGFMDETPEQQVARVNKLLESSIPAIKGQQALAEAVEKAATLQTSAEAVAAHPKERESFLEARAAVVMNSARGLADGVKKTIGTPFDLRRSDAFRAFDVLQGECGGASSAGWSFEDSEGV